MSNQKLSEIRKRHDRAVSDIQHRFGAAYSTRIEQDSYSIHKDREYLLGLIARMEPFVGWTGAPDDLRKELES